MSTLPLPVLCSSAWQSVISSIFPSQEPKARDGGPSKGAELTVEGALIDILGAIITLPSQIHLGVQDDVKPMLTRNLAVCPLM